MRYAGIFLLLAALVPPTSVQGQASDDPIRFILWPLEDVRAVGDGISVRTTGLLALGGAGILALSRYDRTTTEWASGLGVNSHLRVAQEFGNARVVRPALGVILIGSLMTGDLRLQDASFTALESVILANLVTNSLKGLFGRARPWQEEGTNSFEPFSGNTSLPSGHATTAFAALTPFALYYGGVVGGGLYLLAGATAFSRMATNVHWFSDVVAGSAVGLTTAWLLTRRHRAGTRISLSPTIQGAALQIRF
jgi:membrane-associated phospholipid phosphatase